MSSAPSGKHSLRRVIEQLFPWIAGIRTVVGAKGKGLAIRTASGLLHLAGGPEDPAVVRIGDKVDGGAFSILPGGLLQYDDKNGHAWQIAGAVSGSPVVFSIVNISSPDPGKIVGETDTGSENVTCK